MEIYCKKNGFSLVELMVVISIIATLTAILLPNFMGARERARDTQKIQDLESMKNALRSYYNDTQSYPTGTGSTLAASFSTYMPGVSDLDYSYTYEVGNNGESFNVCVNLDSGQGNDDISSQIKCGAMSSSLCGKTVAGTTMDKLFVVCAK
jgi:prepilin-type N-terminal cleavage/methylation domain-containing protein